MSLLDGLESFSKCSLPSSKGGWKTEVFWTKKPTTQEPDVVSSPNFAWWEAF